jgi:CheY-like chemotaxis protein
VFDVYLPIASRAITERPQPAEQGALSGEETVLVAEDEELVRNVVVQLLEHAGYRVLAAENGQHAVQLLQEHAHKVDLALLDVVMPELSGPEAYARLAEIQPGLPVLFSSGYTDSSRFASKIPTDCRVLAKPYRAAELLASVRAVLDESS